MTDSICSGQIRQEARLLFTLLDAIDSEGLLMADQNQTRWSALKARVNSGATCEEESDELYAVITELAHSGAIRGTWMERRWLTTEVRIRGGTA